MQKNRSASAGVDRMPEAVRCFPSGGSINRERTMSRIENCPPPAGIVLVEPVRNGRCPELCEAGGRCMYIASALPAAGCGGIFRNAGSSVRSGRFIGLNITGYGAGWSRLGFLMKIPVLYETYFFDPTEAEHLLTVGPMGSNSRRVFI